MVKMIVMQKNPIVERFLSLLINYVLLVLIICPQ
jgi:hypothetical protein